MRVLYHFRLCPFSRKIRLILAEKAVEFDLVEERPWEWNETFLALNPAGTVPVLVEDDQTTIADSYALAEYLEEAYPDPALLPAEPAARAEVRRLVEWFDVKFHSEVTVNLLYEKVHRRLEGAGDPNMTAIRAGLQNIRHHLDYIGYLVDHRNWLAGREISIADLAAAAHISCLDYIADVPWSQNASAKEWYVRIKSRPSFRALLADHLPGMPPPRYYADLDF